MKKSLLVFLIIILLASFLRLWQLGQVPASPDWDEAALGYNAYSIMQTGRDEYGKILPIVLRSFDDYKPALYVYLAIPSIAIFGLNTFAVRLPSAIAGILTVIAVYFLSRELFIKTRHCEEEAEGDRRGNLKPDCPASAGSPANWRGDFAYARNDVAALVAFLLAISPWHLQFSRLAFESNVGLAFNVFSVLFFLKGLKKPCLLLLSAVFASLALYTYQSEKIFTPLLLISLVLIYRKELLTFGKRYLLLVFLTGMIISLPLVNYTLTNTQALTRARGVSIFADQTSFLQKTSQRLLEDQKNNDKLGILLDNRRLHYGFTVISGYLAHFDLNWLFLKGDEARHHAPQMGLLYLFELPFVLVGIYSLIFGEFSKKTKYLIFSWFFLAPIPASITSGVPHAIRTLNFLPIFQIFVAIGIIVIASEATHRLVHGEAKQSLRKTWRLPRPRLWLGLATTVGLSLFAFNFLYYLNQYFVQQNFYNSQSWQYGYEQIVAEVKKRENQYDKIVISNEPYMDQSYMFFLYYLKYDPLSYQKESQKSSGGFRENHFFGKFEFRPIDWNKENPKVKTLFIGKFSDFGENVKILQSVYFLDGQPDMEMVEKL